MRAPSPIIDLRPEVGSFESAVIEGLTRTRKSISPKFLYDQRGSELFEQICETPEYYVTRTELGILGQNVQEMVALLGPRPLLLEFGSGASRKTRILLDELQDLAAYIPIDISRDFLLASSAALQSDYPNLNLLPICADFTLPMTLPEIGLPRGYGRKAVFFPGSTIGNFDPIDARGFLKRTRNFLGRGGFLLVGVDLVKARSLLEPAYNDAGGVTAAFNLNLLERMKSELKATVDPKAFRHKALFNEKESRIEMHLESLQKQSFEIGDRGIHFHAGETIHTESSYKYTPENFSKMTRHAGYRVKKFWSDAQEKFAVYLLETDF